MSARREVRARSDAIGAGPRTRRGFLGGLRKTLGNIGTAVKKAAVDTGHAAGAVATNPIVQGLTAAGLAATGVGAGPAAAIMASMKGGGNLIKKGGNLKSAATGAVQGGLLGGAAGLTGRLVHPLAVQALHHFTGGGDAAAADGGGGGGGEPDPYADDVGGGGDIGGGGGGGGGGGFWDAAGNFVKGHAGDLLKGGLAVAGGMNAAHLQKKANDLSGEALAGLQEDYKSRAPLRVAGMAGMLAPRTNDLSSLTAHSGPYGKGLPAIAPVKAYA